MSNEKFILLAEIPVKPEYLEEVKALAQATLIPTLKEPGYEILYQTSKADAADTIGQTYILSGHQH